MPDPSARLSGRFLVRFVQKVFKDEWSITQLGFLLDFNYHELERIKAAHQSDVREAGFTLMDQWMARTPGSLQEKRCMLGRALLTSGLRKVAVELGLPMS